MKFLLNKISAIVLIVTVLLFILTSLVFDNHEFRENKPLQKSNDPLLKLLEGNSRFVNNKPLHPDESKERKKQITEEQEPFAAIISCSDSRVPPEIVFDQGLGDLFVIRTAGNLIGEIELGSLEYAVTHLGVRLIVVLGHQNCGVIKSFVNGGESEGYTSKLISMVRNEEGEKIALEASGDKIDNCVWANIEHAVKKIKEESPVLLKEVDAADIKIVGAKYHLDGGKVEIRVIRNVKKERKTKEVEVEKKMENNKNNKIISEAVLFDHFRVAMIIIAELLLISFISKRHLPL